MARETEATRYKQAAEDALQQLDWCIGYVMGSARTSSRHGWRSTGCSSSAT